jgi:putative endonuclease
MAKDESTYCVYILSCADGSFYTGLTTDLDRRLSEHEAGTGSRWTKKRLPVRLVFSLDGLDSHKAALRVENYIKKLSRKRKAALIAGDPNMISLVEKRVQV